MTPKFNFNIGFNWGKYFANNNYHFNLTASYEYNYYFKQNKIYYLLATPIYGSNGDLTLEPPHG